MSYSLHDIGEIWRSKFLKPHFLGSFIWAWSFFLSSIYCVTHFLNYIEDRPGIIPPDPVLQKFAAIDLNWPIFLLVYGGILIAFLVLVYYPERFLLTLQAYGIMVVFRMIAMSVVPFDPPPGMIVLTDPFVEMSFKAGQPLVKDLFFSGHTATAFLMFMGVPRPRWIKILLLGMLILVGLGVIAQHVHYTIDVVAAPFFCFAAFRLSGKIQQKLGLYE